MAEVATPRRIVLAGMLALAAAMGIGRFAFTPLLPMMLHDGLLDLRGAAWLASANYIGYLVGALLCMVQPWLWARLQLQRPLQATAMARLGLVSTVALTLGMALPWAEGWPWLRFAAGMASALVFVYTSGWCLTQMALRGQASLGALIYCGPGAGIVLTGLAASAMVAGDWRASYGWLAFGLLALLLTLLVWPVFHPRHAQDPALAAAGGAHSAGTQTNAQPLRQTGALKHSSMELTLLALAYGIAGFGYIITATFLPVIARQALPGSAWLDLFWPILGLGVMGGAFLASRARAGIDLRWLLALCYLVQACGVALGLYSPSLPGFAVGSLLVGLPFTAITYFAMQEARRLRPHAVPATIGLLTALYGLGQIAGPPLAALLLARSATPAAGFDLALHIAVGSLVLGAGLFGLLARRYPVRSH